MFRWSVRFMLAGVFLLTAEAAAEEKGKTVPEVQAEPYMSGVSSSPIFQRLWAEILQEAHLDASLVNSPPKRRRRDFVSGRLVMECCVAPMWRQTPEEEEVQIFTDSFWNVKEYFVFKKGHLSELAANHQLTEKDLEPYLFTTVRGFTYGAFDQHKRRMELAGWDELFQAMKNGRGDFTLINDAEFLWHYDGIVDGLELGPVYTEYAIKARIHKSQAHLLKPLNEAIARLKKSGRLEDLRRLGANVE